MTNGELLEATMSYIEQHPEEHDQNEWTNACGTAFCFAGHAAILSGVERPVNLRGERWGITFDLESVPDPRMNIPGVVHVETYATRVLGLTGEQANALFDPDNTREELRAMVDKLKVDPDHTLEGVGYVDPYVHRD